MRTTDMADELFSAAAQRRCPQGAVGHRPPRWGHGDKGGDRPRGTQPPRGRYVTLEMPSVSVLDERDAAVIEVCAQELRALLPPEGPVLVLGVGNRRITADALGPRTVRRILVTMGAGTAPPVRGLRPVAAVAPGVAAATGLSCSSWRRRWWGSCARRRWSAWTVSAPPRGSGWGARCSFRTQGFTRHRPTTPAT